jgi:hypothetical protein
MEGTSHSVQEEKEESLPAQGFSPGYFSSLFSLCVYVHNIHLYNLVRENRTSQMPLIFDAQQHSHSLFKIKTFFNAIEAYPIFCTFVKC